METNTTERARAARRGVTVGVSLMAAALILAVGRSLDSSTAIDSRLILGIAFAVTGTVVASLARHRHTRDR